MASRSGFNLHSPNGNDVKHFSMHVLAICLNAICEVALFKHLAYFIVLLLLFIRYQSACCVLDRSHFLDCIADFLSHSVAYVFIFLMVLFDAHF